MNRCRAITREGRRRVKVAALLAQGFTDKLPTAIRCSGRATAHMGMIHLDVLRPSGGSTSCTRM